MAKRKYPFVVGEYYHVYNRGTEKREIFLDKNDLYYFFYTIIISNIGGVIKTSDRNLTRKNLLKKIEDNYENKQIVEIVSYALLPNHFHFVLKEIVDGGISKFMKKLSGSYTAYFNKKYERSGSLFQGPFKSSPVGYTQSLERIVAYVNLNYKHHNVDIKNDLFKTATFEYLGTEKGEKVCSEIEINNILKKFKNRDSFKKYMIEQSQFFIEEHNKSIDGIDFNELEYI